MITATVGDIILTYLLSDNTLNIHKTHRPYEICKSR